MILFLFVVKNADCGFFRWVDDVGITNVSIDWEEIQGKLLENEKIIAELEVEKKILGEKVKKLKMKKHIMEEAMKDKRNELCQLYVALCKYARGEKYAQLAVVMS